MALPSGLVPPLVAVLTVGVSLPVVVGATLWDRPADGPFAAALRPAFATVGLCYLVGVGVVAAVAGSARAGVAATLVVVGLLAFALLHALPLALGTRLVARTTGVADDGALRFAALGWPVATTLACVLFVSPAFVAGPGTHLFHVDGAVAFGALLTVDLLLVVAGPGVVGVVVARRRGRN